MNSSKRLCLLSVEDNPETRLLVKHLLDDAYEVSAASDAEEALGLLEHNSFDLLLLDIHLGDGKNGTELLHEVKDRDDIGDVPAVALTAYAMPGDREELLAEGFDGYVSKPFTRQELTGAITRVLDATEEPAEA